MTLPAHGQASDLPQFAEHGSEQTKVWKGLALNVAVILTYPCIFY
jgi:hypothetical protein